MHDFKLLLISNFLIKPLVRIGLILLLLPIKLLAQPATFTNKFGMEFVLIKPGKMVVGKFQPGVGEPPKEKLNRPTLPLSSYKTAAEMARKSAMPGFTVQLDKSYYIGKFEVTQEQWQNIMGNNPAFFKKDKVKDNGAKYPVESITWQDAQAFVKKLNAQDKQHTYRLPTEFEWEYAARAGAEGDIPWAEINQVAVLGGATTSPIGQKEPNAWGIYDMLGNVWEWVQDYYNEKIFADPVPPKSGKEHVLKGASFTGDVKNATYMTHAAGPGNGFDVGVRLVMEARK
ncbi:formylglycine-generating enzyme family protein [Adhaeribacter radiodurans]|uniref:Formylglycine-generating enzyme family protein n=1 Tax=Adhaeribacter radiodurans TaxID=2745197 RepID=A0A7L7LA63_9BACT|nr:formylglycine-generating enzyme family protein [Adhaeribacter radiodurans]QMU29718.1 formylglycine-generating enzyme family protein [Adhaeribacter radiodurans]